jgi:hypothetical protein
VSEDEAVGAGIARAPGRTNGGTASGSPTERVRRRQRLALGLVLLFVVVTRVGWVLHIRESDPSATLSPDTPSYVQPARALAHTGAFNLRPDSDHPIYLRTPGYPTLIAMAFAVHQSETAFLVLQAVLSCVTVLLAYVIAAKVWRPTVGIAAAAVLAVEPLQFAASGTLLTESIFSLVLLSAIAIGFRAFAPGLLRLRWCALLGGALAIATLIRPTTYYLPLFVTALIVVAARRHGARTVAAGVALFLVPIVLIIGGWQVRNHFEVASWRYSGIEGLDLYAYRGADALARHEGISTAAARRRLARDIGVSDLTTCSRFGDCSRRKRPGPFYDDLSSRGITLVTSYPREVAEAAGRGLAREVFGPGTETVARYLDVRSSVALKVVLAAVLLGIYLAVGYGVVRVIRQPDGRGLAHTFALGTAAYVLLISAGPEAGARFRSPVMPMLALYAGLGLVTGVRRVIRARTGSPRARRNDAVP